MNVLIDHYRNKILLVFMYLFCIQHSLLSQLFFCNIDLCIFYVPFRGRRTVTPFIAFAERKKLINYFLFVGNLLPFLVSCLFVEKRTSIDIYCKTCPMSFH